MTAEDLIGRLFPPQEQKRLEIRKIKGDASNRQYYRIQAGSTSSIACIDPGFKGKTPDAYPFLIVRDLFEENGIRVPAVLAMENTEGVLLIEDCGDLLLQDEIAGLNREDLTARYRQIIDILIRIQAISPTTHPVPFSMSFDREKLMFEFDFFIEHGLRGYFSNYLDNRSIERLRMEFEHITDLLVCPEHFVLNHRDFHCRNILIHHGDPVIIDFQDARLGLPQYDAVSLLRDSYTRLGKPQFEELQRYHFENLVSHRLTSMNFSDYCHYFDLMAFQRNIKALGTFCYQVAVIGNRSFEASITPTLSYLPDYISARKELRVAGLLLQEIIRHHTT